MYVFISLTISNNTQSVATALTDIHRTEGIEAKRYW